MKTVFNNTFKQAVRTKYLQVLSVILLLLFILIAFNSVIAYKARLQSFEKARETVRTAWLNQGPQNPHNSAHYGHFAFQPISAMQFLDNGIRPFTGAVLRLEAHAQNEAAFSPAEGRSELSRFGELSFAWMLQVLLPLFIIILCFNSISADKENQNLKLIAVQSLKLQSYVWGKVLSNYSLVMILAVAGLLIQLTAYKTVTAADTHIPFRTILVWFLLYAIYLLIITGFSVLVSAWVRHGKTSLVVQVSAWVLLMIVMPKITANAGGKIYPMEHKFDFKKASGEDRKKGINGHDPSDERSRIFEDSLLKHYGVKSLADLPINADGLLMQADEDYANLVYDKHFKRVRNNIARQNSISRWASFVNPYLSLRNISMSVCESDFNSQLNFLADAEKYRRYLIKKLNFSLAYDGSKTNDWDWKVTPDYWATVKDISYSQMSIKGKLENTAVEITALITMLLLMATAVVITSKKITVL
ncbi:MAG: DUF3526 domain-containing protein [Chitinophagaceae bacterium]|nr:DUF3526 domain-containing protein [Chitinophagaceae bacterium]